MMSPKPAFFNWVTVRLQWNHAVVLQYMHDLAKIQVDAVNASLKSGQPTFFVEDYGGAFTVGRKTTKTDDFVDFNVEDDCVTIGRRRSGEAVTKARPCVDDNADTGLCVGDSVRAPWQVMRDHLEPFFFGR